MDSPRPLQVLKDWIARHTTQAAFARDCGCSKAYLSELLKGEKNNVSLALARRMSATTGGDVSAAAIMGLDEEAVPAGAEQ